jgi:hypothetical protein
MNRSTRSTLAVALAVSCVLTLASCSQNPAPLSADDEAALTTLAEVAGPTSNVDPDTITSTECWLPSEHLIDDPSVNDTTFRVLCRAHYVDDSGDRYQDATCVGDFAADPILDHCYRWAPYSDMPRFEDFPGVTAP